MCRWAAVLGIILALSRAFIQEGGVAFDPELALLEVVAHTHYLPRHWRGRAHTREVHDNFQSLFPFKVCLCCGSFLAISVDITVDDHCHYCTTWTSLHHQLAD